MSISYEKDSKGDVMVEKEINGVEDYLKIIFNIKDFLRNKCFNNDKLFDAIDELIEIGKELKENKAKNDYIETEQKVQSILEIIVSIV